MVIHAYFSIISVTITLSAVSVRWRVDIITGSRKQLVAVTGQAKAVTSPAATLRSRCPRHIT